jgi:hypothetical protein
VSTSVNEEFRNFVKTSDFNNFITQTLFVKTSTQASHFPFIIDKKTVQNLNWKLDELPIVTNIEQGLFNLQLKFLMSDDTQSKNSFRSAVIYLGKGVIEALEEKRAELMPIFDDGIQLGFGPYKLIFIV